MKNFVLIGLGYVAPKHLKAIKETGNNLLGVLTRGTNAGIMDSYFPDAQLFNQYEIFDRFCEKMKKTENKIDYVSVCTPNYLHDSHIRFGLRLGANVICEKPLVINPWNLESLYDVEDEYNKRVNCILQLRHHPEIIKLKNNVDKNKRYKIKLDYVTFRGAWYRSTWKNNPNQSGSLILNIGIHLFDMLTFIFGNYNSFNIIDSTESRIKGELELKNADVEFLLSIDKNDLPDKNNLKPHRSMIIDNENINFSEGFTDLHTISYEEILKGWGFGILDCLKSINLIYEIRKRIGIENKEWKPENILFTKLLT